MQQKKTTKSTVLFKNPLSFAEEAFAAGESCFTLHLHNFVELIYIKKGSLSYKCDSFEGIAHIGNILVFNYEQIHSATALEEGVEYYSISFSLSSFVGESLPEIVSLVAGKRHFKNFIKDDEPVMIVEAIAREHQKQDALSSMVYDGCLNILVAYLVRNHVYDSTAVSGAVGNRFASAITYVNEHFTENITTKSMAELFSYEESYFCHKFNKITGMSLVNYVRRLRMERARTILIESGRDIKYVAIACGYTDTNYFTRCFKAYYGMTPTKMLSLANRTAMK